MHYDDGAFWRPLFETNMIPLQITRGCSHNKCKFCDMYKQQFSISTMEEIEADIDELATAYPSLNRIFLVGGNAFAMPFDKLKHVLVAIRERFAPHQPSIGCFARVSDIKRKTDDQLKELLALGMDDISIGSESGYDPALQNMNKGYHAQDILDQCRRLDQAHMAYNLFYLLGMAGKGKWKESAEATIKLYEQTHPLRIMVHTMTPFEGTELWDEIKQGVFEPADEIENIKELREFVARAQMHTYILSYHIGNAARVSGTIPEERKKMLEAFDWYLDHADEEELRKFRSSMTSI